VKACSCPRLCVRAVLVGLLLLSDSIHLVQGFAGGVGEVGPWPPVQGFEGVGVPWNQGSEVPSFAAGRKGQARWTPATQIKEGVMPARVQHSRYHLSPPAQRCRPEDIFFNYSGWDMMLSIPDWSSASKTPCPTPFSPSFLENTAYLPSLLHRYLPCYITPPPPLPLCYIFLLLPQE
jgi:hypothetical protein